MKFIEQAPMKARPIRETRYEPAPLQRGEIAYIGYSPEREATLFAVRDAEGRPPYQLGPLLAAAPALYAVCKEIMDAQCDLKDSERRIRLYSALRAAGCPELQDA